MEPMRLVFGASIKSQSAVPNIRIREVDRFSHRLTAAIFPSFSHTEVFMSAQDAKETLLQRCAPTLHPYIEELDRARKHAWREYFKLEREMERLLKERER